MADQQRTQAKRTCPQCGQAKVVPIHYGMPTYEAFEQAQQGAFALGGCVVSGDDPQWKCLECHATFSALPEENAGS